METSFCIESESVSTLLGADEEDIVSTDESITIFILQLTIAVLFRLLQSNVHVTVEAGQNSYE